MWRPLSRRDLGPLSTIENQILQRRELLPALSATPLIVASDYSGDHPSSRFLVYSFLITDGAGWSAFEHRRLAIRTHARLSRRMSFKQLGDTRRANALLGFLDAFDAARGVLFTLAVHKSIGSIMNADGTDFRPGVWKPTVRGSALLISHLVAFLIAGLSRPGQDVLWVSDQDSIAARPEQLTVLTDMVAIASSHLLTHDLGHLRCATTASDPGDLQLEDLTVLADLYSGAVAEMLTKTNLPRHGILVPADQLSDKTRVIVGWQPRRPPALTRLTFSILPVDESTYRVSTLDIHSSFDQEKLTEAAGSPDP